ncbi:DoxX family protein [Chitinophaga nivalis]|uniref:DoxX family protein n=1 Tax=Chitinophaga nivalis TaxID=2991709 RepID=A0ABT3INV7_9BACT|nr:DoxX family protein [Chitinophaga nivalis]MCW3464839.1 DoxX family protein [Chitinophaga nivalis]MCW3485470.1 DoxX family protein [Chitinophaga nivalis]
MRNNITAATRTRIIAYWITTAILTFELTLGAFWDFNLVNKGYVPAVMQHLGYPAYMAIIIGAWKLPAAIVVAAPRMLRLKEWAYAGAFFTFTGAAFSHVAAGDGIAAVIAPLVFAAITVASWALRPATRRMAA